ncbi:TPA: serine protease, partial [Staphylococcus aureus]|nr:serine protease [Staphylococcus aureus]HDJ2041115.1 serine protease [Staphylococcus aureus]
VQYGGDFGKSTKKESYAVYLTPEIKKFIADNTGK